MGSKLRLNIAHFVRALRLPFTATSVLAYVAGAFLPEARFNVVTFGIGLFTVLCVHLSGNLLNDYADSSTDTGPDRRDDTYYGFFGGSKVVQHNIFSQKSLIVMASIFGVLAVAAVGALMILTNSCFPIIGLFAGVSGGWCYSCAPCRMSARGAGEPLVFLLFGPLPVAAGYFLQTGVLWDAAIALVAMPYGLMTTAVLVANEIPDCDDDRAAGKRHLVVRVGASRGWLLFALFCGLAFVGLILLVLTGLIGVWGLIGLISLPAVGVAMVLLKNRYRDKTALLPASKLAVSFQAFTGAVIAMALW